MRGGRERKNKEKVRMKAGVEGWGWMSQSLPCTIGAFIEGKKNYS